jgi:hypothetical protein
MITPQLSKFSAALSSPSFHWLGDHRLTIPKETALCGVLAVQDTYAQPSRNFISTRSWNWTAAYSQLPCESASFVLPWASFIRSSVVE